MKRIIITNSKTNFKCELPETETLAWLEQGKQEGWFGANAVTERQMVVTQPAVTNEEGEVISPEAAEEVEVEIVLAEYTVIIEDITSELEQQRINQEALSFLSGSDYKILRHIREQALSLPTTLSQDEYLALEQERANAAARIK